MFFYEPNFKLHKSVTSLSILGWQTWARICPFRIHEYIFVCICISSSLAASLILRWQAWAQVRPFRIHEYKFVFICNSVSLAASFILRWRTWARVSMCLFVPPRAEPQASYFGEEPEHEYCWVYLCTSASRAANLITRRQARVRLFRIHEYKIVFICISRAETQVW